jgi:hypothetical protein
MIQELRHLFGNIKEAFDFSISYLNEHVIEDNLLSIFIGVIHFGLMSSDEVEIYIKIVTSIAIMLFVFYRFYLSYHDNKRKSLEEKRKQAEHDILIWEHRKKHDLN